jgi:hypothetical protein
MNPSDALFAEMLADPFIKTVLDDLPPEKLESVRGVIGYVVCRSFERALVLTREFIKDMK